MPMDLHFLERNSFSKALSLVLLGLHHRLLERGNLHRLCTLFLGLPVLLLLDLLLIDSLVLLLLLQLGLLPGLNPRYGCESTPGCNNRHGPRPRPHSQAQSAHRGRLLRHNDPCRRHRAG